jgi:hypothetical protein
MHGGAAEELDVEVPHVEPAAPGFAHQCERFNQQPVERFAAACPVAQRQAGFLEVEIALKLERIFERGDLWDVALPLRNATAGETAEDRAKSRVAVTVSHYF